MEKFCNNNSIPSDKVSDNVADKVTNKATDKITYEVISFENWRASVKPLWKWIEDYHWIPIINNPYGMVQYMGEEVFKRTLLFPIAAKINNQQVGWSLVYNISDTAIRVRGVYVDPKARGLGIGTGLYDFALSLWPEPWSLYVGYYDSESMELFKRTWGLTPFPEFKWRTRHIPGQSQTNQKSICLAYKKILRT